LFSEALVNEDEIEIINLVNPEKVDERIIEFLADRDEKILERYLNEEEINVNNLKDIAVSLIAEGEMFPCLCGSGLKNKGIGYLLEILDSFVSTKYITESDFRGTVYKIKHDKNGNKETYIKVESGKINVKDIVEHNKTGLVDEKVNAISVSKGGKQIRKDVLTAGEIGFLSGLKHSYIGEGLGFESDFNDFALIPALRAKVLYGDIINPKEILGIFNILTEEDPSMDAVWIEELGEININVMGLIQLEVLQHVIKERFEIEVEFGKPEVLYKETILNEVTGFGHFEPYKHFSEVEIIITPGIRGEGVKFFSKCSVDKLDLKWQRNIEKNIEDGCKKGILTGSQLTDVNITLISGRAHEKHTSGGDFRQATFRAIRYGLEQSESILLEPYYDFSIKVSQELSGRVMTDMIKMKGLIDAPVSDGIYSIIAGMVPVSTSMDYPSELASFSGGKGVMNMYFKGYGTCHNQSEVVDKMNYDKDGDLEYTSYSVYCSKGKVYTMKGRKD
jgi:translation elongation factor EF-G